MAYRVKSRKSIISDARHFMMVHQPWNRPEKIYLEHINAVVKYGLKLAKAYHADIFVIELSALLHDTGAYVGEDHAAESAKIAGQFLKRFNLPEAVSSRIIGCIENHSTGSAAHNLEEQIIQDADGISFLENSVAAFADIQISRHGLEEGKRIGLEKIGGMMKKVNTDAGRKLAKPLYQEALDYLR